MEPDPKQFESPAPASPDPLDVPPVVRITPEEVAKAPPPPPRPGWPQSIPGPEPKKPRRSKLAFATLILGILSIFLTCIIGGVALLSGALALAALHSNPHLKGMKPALIGLSLGILSCVGWPIAAFMLFLVIETLVA